jgi:hypothetical protein
MESGADAPADTIVLHHLLPGVEDGTGNFESWDSNKDNNNNRKNKMNQHQLDHFPDDVLLIILSYLTSKQLIESVFCLNHKWNALGKRD